MKRNRIANYPALAEVLCVSLSTINRQVTGREAPSPVVIAGLVSRLSVKFDRLLIVADDTSPKLGSVAA